MPFLRHATTDAKNVMVGLGSSATQTKRVMVGTGSSAVEVWPGIEDVEYNFNFPNQDELKWAPISGFDGRTSSNSQMAPGFVFNDMFVAGDNSDPTYHIRLVDRQVDVSTITFEVVLGDVVNTRERPSTIVLASNIIFTRMLIVEFGSNGAAIRTVIDGVGGTPDVNNFALSAGDTFTLTWQRDFGNRFFTRRNNVSTGSVSLAASTDFINSNGRMYPGFGLYSTSNTWSTRIQSVKITGKSSYKTILAASEFLANVTIPQGVWTKVAESKIHTGGTTTVKLYGAVWSQSSSSDDRFFRLKVDGLHMGTTPDEGSSLTFNNMTLFANSVVTIEAFSATSNSSYRKVSGGVLQIGNPSLPT